jgi:hypothetical protein
VAVTTENADTNGCVSALRTTSRHVPESPLVTVRVTSRGLHVPPAIDFENWAALGSRIAGIASACAWCLGDWLVFGERAYGERYRSALATTSLDYQTLRNYAWVARRIPMSRRRETLSFQHHAEVVALPDPEQELWLLRAERLRWSRNELRRRLRAARNATACDDEVVVLRVHVAPDRERRWRRAAEALDEHLAVWVSRAADAAADAVLESSSHTGQVERSRATPNAARE